MTENSHNFTPSGDLTADFANLFLAENRQERIPGLTVMEPQPPPTAGSSPPTLRMTQAELDAYVQSELKRRMNTPEGSTPSRNPTPVPIPLYTSPPPQWPKPMRWPTWDGEKDTYDVFRLSLDLKIDTEAGRLGGDKSICANIFQNVAPFQQPRIQNWLSIGGPGRDHCVLGFLAHMDERFKDRQAETKALSKLTAIRQGGRQRFEDFRQDFELLSAQAGTLAYTGPSKIAQMQNGLNTPLTKALVATDLSDQDFDAFVTKVQRVATRVEALPEFRKGAGHTTSWYVDRTERTTITRSTASEASGAIPAVDRDGDVEMSGINGLTIRDLAALVNALNGRQPEPRSKGPTSKPRAQWLSREDFNALLQAGKCPRCRGTKHRRPNDCKLRAAARPDDSPRISHTALNEEEGGPSPNPSDSEN